MQKTTRKTTNKILMVCFMLMCYAPLAGQGILSGFVSDSLTGERLIGATVYNPNTGKGSTTNAYGFFSIPAGNQENQTLQISFVGYKPVTLTISAASTMQTNVKLLSLNELDEIIVTQPALKGYRNEMNTYTLPIKEIRQLPALGGESDLMKAIQLLPGFKSGSEASGGLYVRGGSPEQNLIMIDDVPLYYVNHLGGFVSIFNADILNDVTLLKGSFPARYGSRLSSVIDVRMRDGNMKKRVVNGTIGMVTTKLSVEGPIKPDTSSYLISVRRCMFDLFMKPFSKLLQDGGWYLYTFFDVNAKFNYKFSETDRLYASFYMGNDKSAMGYENINASTTMSHAIKWGNIAGSLRWNHVFNPKLFANFTAYYTKYQFEIEEENKSRPKYTGTDFQNRYAFRSEIHDINIKADFNHYILANYELRYGLGGIYHSFLPVSTTIVQRVDTTAQKTGFGFNRLNAVEGFSYIENIFQPLKNLHLNLGGRISYYHVNAKHFLNIEPRAMASLFFENGYNFKTGFSTMNQYVHLLTSDGMGIPADYWVPATDTLTPSRAVQWGISVGFQDPEGQYSWIIEPYYKTMDNLIAFKEGYSNLYTANNWQQVVEKGGKGESYGTELTIKKTKGKDTGWIGYTLSWTNRQFNNINANKPYPFRYDRRHDVSIVYNRKLNENIDFSATWVFATGNAFTLATARHFISDENGRLKVVEVYSEKNSFRMKPYHRLDIGMNFRKTKKWGERVWNVSIYNLYNQKNPYFYVWKTNNTSYQNEDYNFGQKLYQYSYFPLIPSVSYSFTF